MKLTPMDIHHKEFRHSLRGYDEKEVDDFLDTVADEFERLFKENIDLSERLEAANETVRGYQEMEKTLHNTLLSAQRSAEEIVNKAREEAATLLRDAEVRAKEVIHDSLTHKQKVAGELVRIKQAEEEFRTQFLSTLEGHLASVREVGLPEDVNVLVGATDEGVVSEVEVATESAMAAVDEAGDAAEAALIQEPAESAEPAGPEELTESVQPARQQEGEPIQEEGSADADEPSTESIAEPSEPGFVKSVTLGETGPPEDLPDDVELAEPKEFPMTSFDTLGEREEDIDIEEID